MAALGARRGKDKAMTVKELIEELKKYDDETEVYYSAGEYGDAHVSNVEEVAGSNTGIN